MTQPPPFPVGVLVAMAALVVVVLGSGGGEVISCGNFLTARHGVITTPNFPGPPPVPLHCRWVINASWAEERNVTVYLTQQYVMSGLAIYDYYKFNDKIDDQLIYGRPNDNAIASEYVRSNRPYVAVELHLTTLVGNHLRVLEGLQEVYGFNVTYEVTHNGEVARGSCSPIICGFVGQCRASQDFRNYSCQDCPEGFFGPNCTSGPMCRENPCQNGGECRSTGTDSIVCKCEGNFTGVFCQYPPIEKVVRECEAKDGDRCSTSSGSEVQPGRMLYTVKVSLVDKYEPNTLLRLRCDKVDLETLISLVTYESLLNLRRNLRFALNSSINDSMHQYKYSEVYDLNIVDLMTDGKMTFQFKTHEDSSATVLTVLNNLINISSTRPLFLWYPVVLDKVRSEKCIGRQIYMHPSGMAVSYHPALYLQKVAPNSVEPMLPGKQEVISCVVTGSPNISFSWFKDNQLVIPGKSNRIWTQIFWESNSTVTSLLGVDNLTPLDDGRWTCEVRDGPLLQARSVDVYVLQNPSVRMLPPMKSTHKGEKVFLSCILSHYGHVWRNEYEYSWTRNGVPFSSGGDHIIDLLDYPNGCLLRIQNINESATYTCHVKSYVGRASASARVEVIFENTTLCDRDEDWPSVPLGTVAMIECPEGRDGSFASRRCSGFFDKSSSRIISQWNEPDYSACLLNEAIRLENHLEEISQGFTPTTPAQVLQELFSLVANRTSLRPGQGETLLAVAMNAWKMSNNDPEVHNQMLLIADLLFTFPKALTSPKTISDISRVAGKAALAKIKSESQSEIPPISLHHLSVSYWDPSLLHVEAAQPSWCATLRFPDRDIRLPIPLTALEFKTLQDIIPYKSRSNSSDDVYQIISTVLITSWLESTGKTTARKNAMNRTSIETTFENLPLNLSTFLSENDFPYWNITCAYTQSIKYSPVQWELGSCTTMIARIQNEDDSSRSWLPWTRAKAFAFLRPDVSVRCFCPAPGICAVLLAGFYQKPDNEVSSAVVVLALWCCAVEATAALILPFVDSWKGSVLKASSSQNTAPSQAHSQNSAPSEGHSENSSAPATTSAETSTSESNTFRLFRVTSCTNVALFTVVMALTMCKWDTAFPAVLLQCLLLAGVSLPTAHLYVVAVELGAVPVFPLVRLWPRQYSRTHAVAVVLSICPVVVFLILWLSIRGLRSTLSQCWTSWLVLGEPACWALAFPSSVIATGGFIMAGMSRKFATIATYRKRVQTDAGCGLVFKLCAIVVCQLAFLLTTIIYTSAPGLASHVALVFTTFLLGYSLLLCYVLRLQKHWPLLSMVWRNGESLVETAQTPRASTSNDETAILSDCQPKWRRLCDVFKRQKKFSSPSNQTCASAPSCTTAVPAVESPDSFKPLIASPKMAEPQSNGVSKKVTSYVFGSETKSTQSLLTPRHPLQSASESGYTYCLSDPGAAGSATGSGSLVALREFETSPLKKINGYLFMRGRRTKVTNAAEVRGGFLPMPCPKRTKRCITDTNSGPRQSTTVSQQQYQFRRRFLRLDDDIQEFSCGS